ncbi:MAG: PAS domain S-box protein [Candidatus Omnitrophica bacterium]|nr:PAS domain S-box protein [Candidatus Omnitrophota bacterium]
MRKIFIFLILIFCAVCFSVFAEATSPLPEEIKEIRVLQALVAETKRTNQLYIDQYNALSERVPGGVVMTTMEGNILYANQVYQNMLGYSLKELRNLTYREITPEKWHDTEEEFVSLALEEPYVHFEKEYMKKDSTVFPILITGWIIKDLDGNPLGTGSYILDLTNRKQTTK